MDALICLAQTVDFAFAGAVEEISITSGIGK